jgi:predicted DCC family thiol-disulfide oxidoreductase YuxK
VDIGGAPHPPGGSDRPILVFDGDCGFCTWSADWIHRRLPAGVVVAPWQRLDLAAHGLTEADVATAAYWIDVDGGLHRGAAGVAGALGAVPGAWGRVGRLLARPPLSWLATGVYVLVARYRHRLPGATPACKLPPS